MLNMTHLIYILEDILHGCKQYCRFDIDMTLVFWWQEGVVRNYPPVIDTVRTNLICPPIVRAAVLWIPILIHHGAIREGLGVMFGTLAIFHASCCWIRSTTWPVNHALLHGVEKLWLWFRIRPTGGDGGVDVLWCQHLWALLQKNKEVHVR